MALPPGRLGRMTVKDSVEIKPIRSRWSYRGATVIYYITLVVRAVYPVFVAAFYVLTAAPGVCPNCGKSPVWSEEVEEVGH